MASASVLAFGQGVELEASAFVPQPGVGVSDFAHPPRGGEGRRRAHRTLDLGDHLGGVAWRPQPMG